MREISFPVEVVEGVPVVTAPEEIDLANAAGLQAALVEAARSELAEPGRALVVVDMSRTRFCDSSGLHALVAAHKRAQAEGGEVLLVIPDAAVLRVFALTAMDRVIPNFTSLAEALARTAATANGNGRRRHETDTVPQTSRGPALAGDLPGTVGRSSNQAQETFARALASAVQVYGEGDQAFRAAYVEFKRTFEKAGDHWVPRQAATPEG